jgi:uncharacterized OB-fold protein
MVLAEQVGKEVLSMAGTEAHTEAIVHRGRIKVPYMWYVGEYGSRFYVELRDNKKIWGTQCSQCGMVLVPPRNQCGRCFVPITEWVELKDTGTLETFTVVHYEVPDLQPLKPPFAYGIIKLDGADTGFVHLVYDTDLSTLKTGMRVQAVFTEERQGNLLDIHYFKPV